MCLENLDLLLEGLTVAKFALEVWRGKFGRYVKKFEPEFGTQQRPPENLPGMANEENPEA